MPGVAARVGAAVARPTSCRTGATSCRTIARNLQREARRAARSDRRGARFADRRQVRCVTTQIDRQHPLFLFHYTAPLDERQPESLAGWFCWSADRLRQAGRRLVLRADAGCEWTDARMGARRGAGQSRRCRRPDPSNEYSATSAARSPRAQAFFSIPGSRARRRRRTPSGASRRPPAAGRRRASRSGSRARPATTWPAAASIRRPCPGTSRWAPGGPTSTR